MSFTYGKRNYFGQLSINNPKVVNLYRSKVRGRRASRSLNSCEECANIARQVPYSGCLDPSR